VAVVVESIVFYSAENSEEPWAGGSRPAARNKPVNWLEIASGALLALAT
jgi:hypothetical protein